MKLFLPLLAVCLLFTSVARSDHDELSVSKRQLDELKALGAQIAERLTQITRDNDDPNVMPRERDRRYFVADMEKVKAFIHGTDGLDAWLKKVTENPAPPGPVPPPQPTFKKITIGGHWVVGLLSLTKDQAEATRSYQADCTLWTALLREMSGQRFEFISCGDTTNVSPYKNVGYYQFASEATLTVRVPSNLQVEPTPASSITGTENLTKDYGVAYKSWRDQCHTWLKNQSSNYGERLVAASCGLPKNVSQYASVGYFLFQSSASVWLAN